MTQKTLEEVLIDVCAITEDQMMDAQEMAEHQASCIMPLKHATQSKLNTLWEYNLRVLEKLRELKAVIKEWESLA